MKKTFFCIVIFFLSISSICSSQLVKTLNGHNGNVLSIKFFPKSQKFATGGSDDYVIIWDSQNFSLEKKLESNLSNILSIAISGDESKLFTSHDRPFVIDKSANNRAIAVWDLNNYKESYPIALDGLLNSVCTSSDGNKLYYAYFNMNYNIISGKYNITESVIYNEYNIKTSNENEYTAAKSIYNQNSRGSKDKGSYSMKVINVSRNMIAASLDDAYIALINTDNKKTVKFLFKPKNKFSGDCIDASPNGKLIAAANYGGENWIYIWNIESGKSIKTLSGHNNDVMCVAFSPDNNYIASGDQDGKIILWEVKSGKKIKSFTGHDGDVNCVAFSPDGKYLISGGDDKLVKVWDAISIIPSLKVFETEYELKFGVENKLQDEMNKQIKLIESNFPTKGEFETSEEFQKRLIEKNEKIDGVREFTALKIEELKIDKQKEFDIVKENEQNENEAKIQSSRKDTVVKITSISNYNADNQTYEIKIKGFTKNVFIPIDKAPKFKENWKKAKVKCKMELFDDLKNYKYFDFVIIDPVTNEEYIFEDINEKK